MAILSKKSVIINVGLSLIATIIMTNLKHFGAADAIICFVVAMFLLTALDIANNWFMYKLLKKKNNQ